MLRDVAFSLHCKARPVFDSLQQQLQQRTVELQDQQLRAEEEARRAAAASERERLSRLEATAAKQSAAVAAEARRVAEVRLQKAKQEQALLEQGVGRKILALQGAFDEEKAALMREKNDAIAGRSVAERELAERKGPSAPSDRDSREEMLDLFIAKDRKLEAVNRQVEVLERRLEEKDRAFAGLEVKLDKLRGHYNRLVEDHERLKAQRKEPEQHPTPALKSLHTPPFP